MHCAQDVRFCGLAHGVLLVIRERDHVLALVPKELVQVCAHVLDIVDAATELAPLAKVVDTNQQRFPAPITCRVLEGVAIGRAVAEILCARGRRWGPLVVLCPLVARRCGHHAGALLV